MKAFTALIALASAVNAHMIMKTPIPAGSPDSSPLSADGSNFPCKTGPGNIDTSKPNVMSIGSPNTLSFTGSATHGGGSCQVSLAKGTAVDKNTKWMVIHSIEGGCPAPNNGNQNLGDDPNGSGASQFQFTIPNHPDLAAGDYTLAWTWHNRIGNREMYMNCAYVKLGGAAKKRYAPSTPAISKRQSGSLPEMFQANIGNGCSTTEGTDVKYPDAGQSVELGPGGNLAPPVGSCGASGAAPANPSSDGSSTPSSSAFGGSPAVSNTVAPVSSATGGFGGGNSNNGQYTQTGGGVFATVGAPDASASPVATETSAAGNPVATGSPNNGQYTQSMPGVFATGAASQSASASAPAVSAPAASAPAVSAPAASPIASVAPVVTPSSAPQPSASSAPSAPIGGGAPSTSSSSVAGNPCSPEGQWSCASDGKSFQRCAAGVWSTSIQMAAGMNCVPGISANFSYNGSQGGGAKRDARSHIARRRHNMHSIFS